MLKVSSPDTNTVGLVVQDDGPTALAQLSSAGRTVGTAETVVAVMAADKVMSLAEELPVGELMSPVAAGTKEGLRVLRDTAALILAMAVKKEYPDALPAGGGESEDGFYYDFANMEPVTPQVLRKLEKRMRRIVSRRLSFSAQSLNSFDDLHNRPEANSFIQSLIKDELADGRQNVLLVTATDANLGAVWEGYAPRVLAPGSSYVTAFKLLSSSAAYWKGNEANESLQRIRGTAWPDAEALARYEELLEEAAKRDHRRLGTELDLFTFVDEVGPGLPILLPNGAIIRDEMERYALTKHRRAGYTLVNTPFIAKEELFLRSGHLPYYADTMFPAMDVDGAKYYLKAMNCPMHALIFKNRGRSYKELPLRLFEFGAVHRLERSGTLHGLTRVRNMTQDDAHIFCAMNQIQTELKSVLAFVLNLLREFGLEDFYLELSTRDDSDKYIGAAEDWTAATSALEEAAHSTGLELVPDPGGAAFYGPKISVQVRDSLGRNWQMSTIQLDFQTPERFDLSYQAADGSRMRPVMIHRALFGSIERFLGVLTEHYGGAFPAWLAPTQVVGIPVKDDPAAGHVDYLSNFLSELEDAGVRTHLDVTRDRLPKKILNAQKLKAPFVIVAGDRDVSAGTAALRFRDGSQMVDVQLGDLITKIQQIIIAREARERL
ncbi:threonyl-tRNA synthetase [Arthrobacter sp. AG258]|uniref:threonine--tRNA ligase n=1 Tax=Arthrobacter sp. AG258 TaxID=2183899 RepID=UPI00105BB921|nr:threonine--tRNA ligase [Arthrobacter sp. AG258]TDT81857.1 threonyl-tRNA synthetase [Arthrobacter sp. AG258]